MLCEGEQTAPIKSVERVLILVLMEDALRVDDLDNYQVNKEAVLILVLMEDALRVSS